jgi:DNA (cytosine-5)-methyltransferase 1
VSLFEAYAPPYRRMTMADVRAVPSNGLTCVGSFSGCGGSSLGLKMAGWDVRVALEFVPAAAETYRANFPETTLFERDVRDVEPRELLDAARVGVGELDLLEGSPPCSSFSMAGARERLWGRVKAYSDTRQRTDDLFFEWARLLAGTMPRAFLAENVPGLTVGNALEEYAWKITAALSDVGYRVAARVVNAAHYGVPQERRRLIFVGFRVDQDVDWAWPAPTTPDPHTIRQALADVDPADPDHASYLDETWMGDYAVGRTLARMRDHLARYGRVDESQFGVLCERCGGELHDGRSHEVVATAQDGRVTKARCREDGQPARIVKSYYLLRIPDLDRPSPTILGPGHAGMAGVCHPVEDRKMTPAEVKSIGGFPPDFVLTGTRAQRYERIGRAVPPPMYRVIGGAVADALAESVR